jgi:large subunit ribosomal protein L29
MKVDELTVLEREELAGRLKLARRELYELRFKLAVGQLEDNHQIRRARKDIARILTVIHQRELGIAQEPEAEAGAAVAVAAPEAEEAEAVEAGAQDAETAAEPEAAEPEAAEPEAAETAQAPEAEASEAPRVRRSRRQPAQEKERP